ncbi:Single-stranded DNA-binding protein 3 [Bagarius yarrelli]|uniref:Single-stranded DNA-binding protein 3 n=1 Tax=Bagarius yarrelli TaxID=175774 RepID=A0A556VUS4_BAGYA|nr:Single-stranded DNA-binding protein 3 [Bagarius yarrelli]
MFPKGKSAAVPSDGQAREKLALYVYEYLLHIGAQKSAQTFLSEIRWEKNITLGDPPGFLHSWWCVFWDLYCAAPERRDSCEHSSEAKAFHDYGPPGSQSSPHAQPPNSMMGPHGQPFMSPRFGGGPRPPIRMGNQNFGGGMRPPHNSMGPGMPGVAMGPGNGRPPWPNPNTNNMPYSSPSPGAYGGPQGGGPPGTPGIVPSPADSNNSSENLYTMMNSGGGRSSNSPNNMSNMSNNMGTPRDDDTGGSYLHSFQNENASIRCRTLTLNLQAFLLVVSQQNKVTSEFLKWTFCLKKG